MNSGDYIVIQQKFPFDGLGHIVVIVGYDPNRGFKIKSTDENDVIVKWIPKNRINWLQSFITEEDYQAVTFDHSGMNSTVQNGQHFNANREKVISALQVAHQVETGEQLRTDFNHRPDVQLFHFGFVLKFNKMCRCQDKCCKDTVAKGAN